MFVDKTQITTNNLGSVYYFLSYNNNGLVDL